MAAAADRAFARWSGGPESAPALPSPERAALAGKVVVVDKPDLTQSQVRLGSVAFRRAHPDFLASQVVNAVLGGGFTSRLGDEIRPLTQSDDRAGYVIAYADTVDKAFEICKEVSRRLILETR